MLSSMLKKLIGWRPSLVGFEAIATRLEAIALGYNKKLVGWRPSLVGCRPSLVRIEAMATRLEAIASLV